ncbi:unnamed protein product [Protopolystoma xenopodis]|uniref:Uncharacterized protein n=1 Tax=Protopolystoma xenopodis TaxID=117903 RepID=A0A448X5Z9_9PLAT|nr:unnamed protein product [Protopolystoma xenopodis]
MDPEGGDIKPSPKKALANTSVVETGWQNSRRQQRRRHLRRCDMPPKAEDGHWSSPELNRFTSTSSTPEASVF